ncbi:MAG: GNAT family N-acetyltransferase [Pirellulales bacterium]|nr:GNAT family N-acetyltransferase [Pirellulales bacterium]
MTRISATARLPLNYYKRYRMELDLRGRGLLANPLPAGFRFVPWHQTTLEQHAQAKFLSFHQEIDSQVFACLRDYEGCLRLMREIARKPGFMPQATWLLVQNPPASSSRQPTLVGTIQGIVDHERMGGIQNVGILPMFRQQGLGTALLFQAFAGFLHAGITRAALEVTSRNERALQLYRRLGFRKIRTVYKVIERNSQ